MAFEPYVSVTGITALSEILPLIRCNSGAKNSHRLIAGILMSSRTLAGLENEHRPRRYADRNMFERLCIFRDPRIEFVVHYSCKEPRHHLIQDIDTMMTAVGPNIAGFQLNMTWPDLSLLDTLHDMFGRENKRWILQIGQKALEEIGYNAEVLVERVGEWYLPLVTDVLLDLSAGEGVPLDADKLRPFLEAFRREPNIGTGVAGKLGPKTLHLLGDLCVEFPRLSLDSESEIRDRRMDIFDIDAAQSWVCNSFIHITMAERRRAASSAPVPP